MYVRNKSLLPKGWRDYVHPEGDTYYFNEERRLVTANDPRDPSLLDVLIKCQEQLRKQLNEKAKDRWVQCELWLDVTLGANADPTDVRYYFVDHATWGLFWLDEVSLASLGFSPLDDAEISESLSFALNAYLSY